MSLTCTQHREALQSGAIPKATNNHPSEREQSEAQAAYHLEQLIKMLGVKGVHPESVANIVACKLARKDEQGAHDLSETLRPYQNALESIATAIEEVRADYDFYDADSIEGRGARRRLSPPVVSHRKRHSEFRRFERAQRSPAQYMIRA